MNISIGVGGTSNQLFKRSFYTQIKFSVVSGKTPFFVIDPFCAPVAYLRGYVGCGRTPLRILSALFRMLSALFAHYFVLKSEHFKSILQFYEASSRFLKITVSKFITSSLQPVNLILVDCTYFFTSSFFKERLNGCFGSFHGC